ncbi:MAG: NAD(P)/FAD-dependent oxidoreductase [Longimicrobiales bacterium]
MTENSARPFRGSPRIVILGGGVGGLAAARHMQHLFRRSDADIVLVSRDNFFLLPPLLFEACSGVLELRHCAQPIRPCLRRVRFMEATVLDVDVGAQLVHARPAAGAAFELPYDHLVVALGASTDLRLIPGSERALTFKTVADALHLRNRMIERFEHADIEPDPERRRRLLTVVVVGGGLVGTELLGELTAFADAVLRYYPLVRREDVRFHLFEAGPRLMPESTLRLGAYATRVLERRGVQLHLATPVDAIEPGIVRSKDGVIEADTVLLAAGIVPSAVAASIAVERDGKGRIVTLPTLRSASHAQIWGIGDAASVPAPGGGRYPALAQHATRQGKAVAHNVHAAVTGKRKLVPFTFRALGTMAAFGHNRAAADLRGLPLSGFIAWWLRRTYYLFQIPRWDTRLRIAIDWTISLFFRPDITKVQLATEREQDRALNTNRTGQLTARHSRGHSAGESEQRAPQRSGVQSSSESER